MRRLLRNFLRSDTGSVAPTVGLSLFALIAAGGIAFDYARLASMDTELQNAADQAALAAASQLDGESQACARAIEAARNLVSNDSRFANDGRGLDVTIADSAVCTSDTDIVDDPAASIRFFQDKAATIPATNNSEARFVEVSVDTRVANYALTPIVGALTSGEIGARARAGLGTALCKVPPLMVCPPSGGVADWNALRGHGIRAVSNTGTNWAPGAFGYIGPNDTNSTQIGLAFENPVFQCQQITGEQPVDTGQPTPAITAINTRFDIYGMSGGAGQALSPCLGSACPPALNVTKDLVRQSGGGQCGIRPSGHTTVLRNEGWHLIGTAANRFRPREKLGSDTPMTPIDANGVIDAMGLPRDNMHYCSYNAGGVCNTNRFGDGVWARGDYFNKYHAGRIPANAATMTRYETYLWEIANGFIPSGPASGNDRQEGRPVCNATVPDPSRDRRVLTVAVAGNCPELRGTSVPVQIVKWVDMFLVEPGVGSTGGRGNGDDGNEIYLEVIREVDPGGSAAQIVRRDTPYLVR
jgi:Flp pilus assembly protein TadG